MINKFEEARIAVTAFQKSDDPDFAEMKALALKMFEKKLNDCLNTEFANELIVRACSEFAKQCELDWGHLHKLFAEQVNEDKVVAALCDNSKIEDYLSSALKRKIRKFIQFNLDKQLKVQFDINVDVAKVNKVKQGETK